MVLRGRETLHGFLIHDRPVGEARYLACLFTAEHGVIRLLASGEAPEKGRLAQWSIRRGEQDASLRDYRFTGPRLLQTPSAGYSALYVHELFYRLGPVGVGDTELFQSFSVCLVDLNYPDRQVAALRRLEADLLQALGQAIDYRYDSEQRPIQPQRRYRFIAQHGFTTDPKGRYSGRQVLAADRLDASIDGALSLTRQCHARQFEALLMSSHPIVSRRWQKR